MMRLFKIIFLSGLADLPSQKGYLWFSMKVWRGRVRGANQPYQPTHQWQGKNWHTEALENWVLELYQKDRPTNELF